MIEDWFDGPELDAAKSIKSTLYRTHRQIDMLEHAIFDKELIYVAFRDIRDKMLDTVAKISWVMDHFEEEQQIEKEEEDNSPVDAYWNKDYWEDDDDED